MIDNHTEYRQLFPFTGEVVYLNHAAVSPLNSRTIEAMQAYQEERSSSNIEYWPDLFDRKQQFKELVGKLINAHPDYIAMTGNTGMGLNMLALGIDWKPGDRILLNNLEFPTNVYPFMNLKRFGVEVDFVAHQQGRIRLEDIVRKIHPRTRLLSVSFVEFLNGFRNDMKAIADICREHNIIFSVDGIQGVGALPFDVQEMGVDFLACGGHKWLMWPMGTAFFYISPRIFESVYPAMVNWMSVENAWDMLNYELKLLPTAERFEGGVFNLQGIIGATASLELFLEIGVNNIENHVLSLTNVLIEELKERDYHLFTITEEKYRSGIVTFHHDHANDLFEYLMKRHIHVSLRDGMIRVAPHFYNTTQDMEQFIAAMDEFRP